MAEPLDAMPKLTRSAYPWAEWLDGRPWKTTRGTDFTVSVHSFVAIVYQAGQRHGLQVKVHQRGDDVYLQAQVHALSNGKA